MTKKRKIGGISVKVVPAGSKTDGIISKNDEEMDKRAIAAVRSAIKKAEICQKPIAKYDARKKKAYVQYTDGVKEYVN